MDLADNFGLKQTCDAFACTRSARSPDYWTEKHNALTQSWTDKELFLNPPAMLLEAVITKIFEDKTTGILILPLLDYPFCVSRLRFISLFWFDILPSYDLMNFIRHPAEAISHLIFRVVFFNSCDQFEEDVPFSEVKPVNLLSPLYEETVEDLYQVAGVIS